eukprot:3520815-Prymnesium_polylepis.2
MSICGCPEWGLVERCKGMTSGDRARGTDPATPGPGRTPPPPPVRGGLGPASASNGPMLPSGRLLNPSTAHHILGVRTCAGRADAGPGGSVSSRPSNPYLTRNCAGGRPN